MSLEIGKMVNKLRSERGLSLRGLAQLSGVGKSSLSRWEAGSSFPGIPEIEAVLNAMQVSEDERKTALGQLQAPRALERLQALTGDRPPLSGDLLKAMRLRSRLTQTEVASRLGITQGMLAKWEIGGDWPSEERIHSLCYILRAREEELIALLHGRFLPSAFDDSLWEWDKIFDISQELMHPSAETSTLRDLRFITLESHLWHQSLHQPAASYFLTRTFALHSRFLHETGRLSEAHRYSEKTLLLVKQGTPALVQLPDPVWLDAVMVRARLEGCDGARPDPSRAAKILIQWLPEACRLEYRAWMLSDIAMMLSHTGDSACAVELSSKAIEYAARGRWAGEVGFRTCDHARVLLGLGRPGKALKVLTAKIGEFEMPATVVSALIIMAQAFVELNQHMDARECLHMAHTKSDGNLLTIYKPQIDMLQVRMGRETDSEPSGLK